MTKEQDEQQQIKQDFNRIVRDVLNEEGVAKFNLSTVSPSLCDISMESVRSEAVLSANLTGEMRPFKVTIETVPSSIILDAMKNEESFRALVKLFKEIETKFTHPA